MTSPLSRMTSMTSTRPLGRGRSTYPRGWVEIAISGSPPVGGGLGLVRSLVRCRLLAPAHQGLPDVRAVLGQGPRNLGLANAVQVADRPVELLQGVLGGAAVTLGLVD